MSDFLVGKERSGTPLETRGGSDQLARLLESILRGGEGGGLERSMAPFHRMGAQSFMNQFGLDPSELGIGDVARSVLADPADRTRGLFAAMEPFERRETEHQVGNLRDIFGTMGGRFSRNVGDAETQLRGELGGQFARSREQSLLEAGGQRIQALLGLLQGVNESSRTGLAPLEMMMNFFRPGEMVWQEGVLPDLIRAGGNVAAHKFGG